jgi:hypothetical protein
MALEAQNNPFTSILMVEAADPEALPDADPAAGQRRLAVGTDHLLYLVSNDGVKTLVGGAGIANPLATDSLWDAAGDLVQGSGANTAAKLSAGTAGKVLTSNGAAAALTWETPSGGSGSVASDTIWDAAGDLAVGTGADTAAKLTIGAVGGVVGRINGAVAWNGGTSFPGSKATGDRFWRSDLSMEFYWDGTRWLSSQLFIMSAMSAPTALPITANTGFWLSSFGQSTNSIYVVDFRGATYVVTTNTGSLFWTVRLADIGSTTVGSATFTTAADTPDVLTSHIVAVNTVVTTPSLFQIVTTKTSTPGNMYLAMFATYRIIAT